MNTSENRSGIGIDGLDPLSPNARPPPRLQTMVMCAHQQSPVRDKQEAGRLMRGRRRRSPPSTGLVWLPLSLTFMGSAVRYAYATMPPYPLSFGRHTQPDGTDTGDLFLRGTPEEHNVRVEDGNGFTLLRDDADVANSYYSYAMRDPATGELVSSRCVVGRCDPAKEGFVPHVQPDDRARRRLADVTGFGMQNTRRQRRSPSRSLMATSRRTGESRRF